MLIVSTDGLRHRPVGDLASLNDQLRRFSGLDDRRQPTINID